MTSIKNIKKYQKVGILLGITILIFILLNIPQIQRHIFINKGNSLYKQGKFDEAIKYYIRSESDIGTYNKSNILYKQGKFDEAHQGYGLVNTGNNEIPINYIYHNLGNTLYQKGIQDPINRVQLWKDAIKYYQNALTIKNDDDTIFNKKVVEDELNKLKKQETNKEMNKKTNKKDNKGQNSNNGSGGNKTGNTLQQKQSNTNSNLTGNKNNTGDNKKNNERSKNLNNTGNKTNTGTANNKGIGGEGSGENQKLQYNTGSSSGSNTGGNKTGNTLQQSQSQNNKLNKQTNQLNQEQTQAIQEYKKKLTQEQSQYGQYYNKTYKEQNNDPFQNFFNDPFFNNSSLYNQNQDKKDR